MNTREQLPIIAVAITEQVRDAVERMESMTDEEVDAFWAEYSKGMKP